MARVRVLVEEDEDEDEDDDGADDGSRGRLVEIVETGMGSRERRKEERKEEGERERERERERGAVPSFCHHRRKTLPRLKERNAPLYEKLGGSSESTVRSGRVEKNCVHDDKSREPK